MTEFMALPVPLIDHVIINARDRLDEAAALYARLGFQITPRGYHSLGSINNLAILGTDYIELLGVPPGGGRTDVLDWPPGLNGLAFKTLDGDGAFAALHAAGVPVLPAQPLARPVDMGSGAPQEAAFRNVRLAPGASPSGRMFFCHHLTPQFVWHDPWRRHANGALGIAGIVIAADDPAPVCRLFARMFGAGAVRGSTLLAGLADIETVTPGALAARFGAAAPDAAGRAHFMAALVLRTASLDQVRAAVPDAVAFEDGLLVPARHAGNVALVFRG